MSKGPLKLSGLVASGRVASPVAQVPSAFDLPVLPAVAAPGSESGEVMLDVAVLDDAPFQSRKKVDPVHVDEIGQSLETAGQRTPITVRKKPNGRYEVIKGMTRRMAAISRGITQLRALVVERNDRDAKLDLWLDNEGRKNNDYEYALMFRQALEERYATTQKGIGNLFGCSQGKVSKCLGMLDLPQPVLDMLEKEPALIGAATAPTIAELWREHPGHHDVILQALQRVAEGADQNGLKPWILQRIKSASQATGKRARNHHIPHPSGSPAFVTIEKGRDLVLRLADAGLDMNATRKAVEETLARLVKAAEIENS